VEFSALKRRKSNPSNATLRLPSSEIRSAPVHGKQVQALAYFSILGLAGANLDNGDPGTLLFSMTRFFKFLSGEQKQEFLHGATTKSL